MMPTTITHHDTTAPPGTVRGADDVAVAAGIRVGYASTGRWCWRAGPPVRC